MKLAIMQPYFFPYIGYFQLIASVDRFVVYDNIEYTKKGWINRNRFLRDGEDVLFSIPLKKGSDHLHVRDRELAADFNKDKLLNQLAGAYKRAPHFSEVFPLVERAVRCESHNLFDYILHSLVVTCEYLDIKTELLVSSTLDIDHTLRGKDKVRALCRRAGADTYINAIGGRALYAKEEFLADGLSLHFLKSADIAYPQFEHEFVPWLSIIDVMMFNSRERISEWLASGYELV